MTTRRSFLRTLGLASGAVLVGDEVLSAFERLTHRKVFALGGLPSATPAHIHYSFTALFPQGWGDSRAAQVEYQAKYHAIKKMQDAKWPPEVFEMAYRERDIEKVQDRAAYRVTLRYPEAAVFSPTTGTSRLTFAG